MAASNRRRCLEVGFNIVIVHTLHHYCQLVSWQYLCSVRNIEALTVWLGRCWNVRNTCESGTSPQHSSWSSKRMNVLRNSKDLRSIQKVTLASGQIPSMSYEQDFCWLPNISMNRKTGSILQDLGKQDYTIVLKCFMQPILQATVLISESKLKIKIR